MTKIALRMLGAALLVAVTAACSTPTPAQPPTTSGTSQTTAAAKNGHTIEYQVEGTAPSLTVTYSTFTGGQLGVNTVNDVKPPWKQSTVVPPTFAQAGLMAVTGRTDGDVTCRVVSGGKVLAENRSSGAMAIASCTANL